MKKLNITDVRILPGDSGFLIDDGCTAILYDSGFGFTGKQMAERIRQELGTRKLDYIFLTHSHYDHVLGSTWIAKMYPEVKIVAGTYTHSIFQKTSARSTMQEIDQKAANQCAWGKYDDLSDALRVDIAVEHGDILDCGDLQFRVIALPGHTRCSVGFYLEENKLLLGTETLGVYVGKGTYLPSYLVGYRATMDSFQKAKALGAKQILIPHYGLVENEEAQRYLDASEHVSQETAQIILGYLSQGMTHSEILNHLTKQLYQPHVAPVYPHDAFQLNTAIMIRLIEKELR